MRAGIFVTALDQQPLWLVPAAGPLEGEAAVELAPMQHEDGVATVERLGPGHTTPLLIASPIPDDHPAAAGRPLKFVVRDLVVLDLDGQAFHRGIQGRAFGHRPGTHRAVDLETKIEVVSACLML